MLKLINYHRKQIENRNKALLAIQKRLDKDPLTRAKEKRCRIVQLTKEIKEHELLLATARRVNKQLAHLQKQLEGKADA